MSADVEPVRERAAGKLGDQDEQCERQSRQQDLVPSGPFHPDSLRSATRSGQTRLRVRGLTDQRECPLVGAALLEADEQDPLPLTETEVALRVRNLLLGPHELGRVV